MVPLLAQIQVSMKSMKAFFVHKQNFISLVHTVIFNIPYSKIINLYSQYNDDLFHCLVLAILLHFYTLNV